MSNDPHGLERSTDDSDRVMQVAGFCVGTLLLCLVIVLVRVGLLQWNPPTALSKHTPRTFSRISEHANRGDLLDRRGRVLSSSRLGKRLFADPSLLKDTFDVAATIGERIGVRPVAIDRRLQPRLDSRYVVLVDLLNDDQIAAFDARPRIAGVALENVPVRHRPFGDLAASLIGKVGTDHIGLTGMELVLHSALSGQPGELRYLRDVRRQAMWVEQVGYEPAVDGEAIRLSLDIEIQQIATEELASRVEEYNAGGGRVVALDPRTGELLAMVSIIREKPDVVPYATDPMYTKDASLRRLRCLTDAYEPGSTFKPFVWAAATEFGKAKPDEIFDAHDGVFRTTRGRRIRDSHPHSKLTWDEVLINSSNIGMAQVAERMTDRQMQDALRGFGFGQATGCGLPGETAGLVTSPKNWTHYSQTSVSFGQEIAVTPVQMVRAFSAIAGDGTIPTIRTLAVDQGPFNDEPSTPTAWVERRAIAESVALQTRYVLRRVMTDGTGRRAEEGARYRMFGKSGTAEMPDLQNGGYYEDRYIANFIAGAPLEDPRLVVICVVEDPDKSISHWGGAVCGPVVRNIMNRSLEYLGVRSDIADAETEEEPLLSAG